MSKQSEYLVFNSFFQELSLSEYSPCRASPLAGALEGMGSSRTTRRGLVASYAMPATCMVG